MNDYTKLLQQAYKKLKSSVYFDTRVGEIRKAISYGKLVNGVDVCKYGKQWVVSKKAMVREYGQPANG